MCRESPRLHSLFPGIWIIDPDTKPLQRDGKKMNFACPHVQTNPPLWRDPFLNLQSVLFILFFSFRPSCWRPHRSPRTGWDPGAPEGDPRGAADPRVHRGGEGHRHQVRKQISESGAMFLSSFLFMHFLTKFGGERVKNGHGRRLQTPPQPQPMHVSLSFSSDSLSLSLILSLSLRFALHRLKFLSLLRVPKPLSLSLPLFLCMLSSLPLKCLRKV